MIGKYHGNLDTELSPWRVRIALFMVPFSVIVGLDLNTEEGRGRDDFDKGLTGSSQDWERKPSRIDTWLFLM